MHDVQPAQHSLRLLDQVLPPLPCVGLVLAQLHGIQFQDHLRQDRLAELLVLDVPRPSIMRRVRDILYALRHEFRTKGRCNLSQFLYRRLRLRWRRRARRASRRRVRRRSQVLGITRTRAAAAAATAAASLALLLVAAVIAFLLAGGGDGTVDLDGRPVEAVGAALRVVAVHASLGRDGFADDAEQLALLLQPFGVAGLGVVFEDAPLVEEFDASLVVRVGLSGGFLAQVADGEVAVADAEGAEVERVGDASVL